MPTDKPTSILSKGICYHFGFLAELVAWCSFIIIIPFKLVQNLLRCCLLWLYCNRLIGSIVNFYAIGKFNQQWASFSTLWYLRALISFRHIYFNGNATRLSYSNTTKVLFWITRKCTIERMFWMHTIFFVLDFIDQQMKPKIF